MSFRKLPDDLLQMVLGMIPFPYVFQGRVLSKSWLARLSPSSSQDEEEMKTLAIRYQKSMAEYFVKWKAFGPVFAGDEGLFAYDEEKKSWLSIPTLSLVPPNLLIKDFSSYDVRIEGALLLFVNQPKLTLDDYLEPGDLYVTNVLTRSWKHLPARPPVAPELGEEYLQPCGPTTLVSCNDAYKVIEFYTDKLYSENRSFALIYNSKLSAWSWKNVGAPLLGGKDQGVHLYGVVYWLVGSFSTLSRNRDLLTFNVEEETFQTLPTYSVTNIPATPNGEDHLLVCNDTLFMVVINIHTWTLAEEVIVVKSDPVSHTMVTVTEGGAATLAFGKLCLDEPPASHGDFIFLLGASCDKVLAYDTAHDAWSSFSISLDVRRSYSRQGCRWTSYSFQPGLNPFVEL